jgi:hypothetical protein
MVQGVQFRRGTTAQHAVFTGQPGEITVDSDKKIVVVHDGSAVGGYETVGAGTTQRITNKDINSTALNASGISTISSAKISSLNVTGISTLGYTTTTSLNARSINASGISTFGDITVSDLFLAGITTGLNSPGISTLGFISATTANISGVSTLGNTIVGGSTTALIVTGDTRISGATTITGNLNAAGNSYIKLARLTNQTVTNGIDTLIGFSVVSDPNSWYSGITTRTTPTVAGTYHVDAMLHWNAGSIVNNQTNIQIRKNGSTFALSQVGIHTFAYTQNVCGIVTMNGTSDYIDFTAFTGNTTNQVVTGTADGAWTKMEIFKIN